MKEKILNKIINKLKENSNYSFSQLKIIRYGLDVLYLTITKLLIIVIFSIILKTKKELLFFIICYSILKCTGFGLHMKKSYLCWITTLPIFILIPILIKNVCLPNYIIFTILPISYLSLCIFAPSDTEKRPLINKKKRIIYKLLTIITSTVYILLIFYLNNDYITSILFYSLLLESLLTNPISYMLFGLKYNNYKNYERRI